MALALYFRPQDFPRTMNREQWRTIWRWKRIAERALAVELDRQMKALATADSAASMRYRSAMVSALINPPLLVHSDFKPSILGID